MYLVFLNRWHGKKRVQLGKRADIVDGSMMKKKEMQQTQEERDPDQKEQGANIEDDNGLQDLSDLKNEDFIYVY
jgi:hypothetical protein